METFSDEALKRTHHCNALRSSDLDAEVRLAGWVRSYRDHGGVVFIDLRDREGITQIVFDPDVGGEEMHALARAIRNEWVISVKGKVGPRGEDRINPKLDTGEIEVICDELHVLNRSQPVPFEPDEYHSTSEENRLKYRYIDLRRTEMMNALRLRHQICRVMRSTLDDRGFVEVETPFLTKSTPEGARDFLVPSRMQHGAFYALPQSPQLFKQILMVGGLDRYYQIVRCFRDEDLRADRQPEFTQLDIEMSFCTENDVMDAANDIMRAVSKIADKPFPDEVPVMTFDEAVTRFGSDRPDLRFGMELIDISDLVGETDFGVFKNAVDAGGVVKCIVVSGGAEMTRKETDGLAEWAKGFGAGGMAVTKIAEGGELETGIAKFMAPITAKLVERTGAKPGDLLCFGSDKLKIVNRVLGELRCKLAKERGMIDPADMKWVWVVDFPLVEWNEDENRWDSLHHPFTAPKAEDMHKLDSDPGSVRSRAYDIVCNGMEMGGGSIRIHNLETQEKVFALLGIDHDQARAKFSFLLDALAYGAPPHGGIAFGLDRTAMVMTGATSIRDVIAFPKTQRGFCPMTEAPSDVDHMQLTELNLRILDEPHNQ